MQPETIVMMIIILGVVWGGFVALLIYAMKVERRRSVDDRPVGNNAHPGGGDG